MDVSETGITCTPPIATSGYYAVVVWNSKWGLASSYPIVELQSGVDSIYPTSGSLGGAELTLTGSGFGESIDDNKVYFGGEECVVSSASSTEIVCRAPEVSSETYLAVTLYINDVLSPNLCVCADGIQASVYRVLCFFVTYHMALAFHCMP
eukprot:scaffold252364_cov41-Prasinocladus_malaysianus.AAC.1